MLLTQFKDILGNKQEKKLSTDGLAIAQIQNMGNNFFFADLLLNVLNAKYF